MTISIDGAARGNPGPAGYGVAATGDGGALLKEAYGYIGDQTNNIAEYCALLAALNLAKKMEWRRLRVRSDSQLLVRQLEGSYKVKNERLRSLYARAVAMISRLDSFAIEHVPRSENKQADKLANKAIDTRASEPRGINPILVMSEGA